MDSPPLRNFLASLGRVQHHVHTAVVGLAAVESGDARKPDDLDIAWNARDPKGSSREARRFILRSTLVMLAEELSEYAKGVLRFRGQPIPAERAERLDALGRVAPEYLLVAAVLVSHWRNRIIHRSSKAELAKPQRQSLFNNAETIARDFKNLDVGKLLADFENDQPTLKDVTVLLAMSIRFARAVDTSLAPPDSPAAVKQWLVALDLFKDVERYESQATKGGSQDPRAKGRQFLLTRAPTLAAPYYQHGTA